jgi:hypothetical protein
MTWFVTLCLLVIGLSASAREVKTETELERGLAAIMETFSANFTLPGCRPTRPVGVSDRDYMFLSGLCQGKMSGVVDTAQKAGLVCPPDGTADYELGLHVIVRYIDSRPARKGELFTKLALEALRAEWPCR